MHCVKTDGAHFLKTFSAVFFTHPIAQVSQNPGIADSNPTGGVTFYLFLISLFFKVQLNCC